jgi:hypothetical protein
MEENMQTRALIEKFRRRGIGCMPVLSDNLWLVKAKVSFAGTAGSDILPARK